MRLPSERLALQHHGLACAYYALINLYLLRGLIPPTFEQLADACGRIRGEPATYGLTPVEQLQLLHCFRFPALVLVGAIPMGQTARDVFPAFLAQGCTIIAFFNWRRDLDEVLLHTVVVERATRCGFVVLDSTGGYEENSTIELEPMFTPEDVEEWRARKAAHPHGIRRVLPFYGTVRREGEPGIYPYFLVVHPTSPPPTSCVRTQLRMILKTLSPKVTSRY